MKTLHVVILAAAILGAAWILKPAPVEQVSQRELERRENLERWLAAQPDQIELDCLAAMGKTRETLDLSDPKQNAAWQQCRWPDTRGSLRRTWDWLRARVRNALDM